MVLKCKHCDNSFESARSKKFCSIECAKKANYNYKPKIIYNKKCKNCGKEFSSSLTKQIYCSNKCQSIHYAEINKNKINDRIINYFQIFRRDNFKCVYCGKSVFRDGIKLVLDHIEPRKNGVDNNITNLATACYECNSAKSNTSLPAEIVAELKKEVLKRTLEHKLDYAMLKDYFDKIYKKK